MESDAPRWVGARVQRVEDPRFLAGRGRFVDDLNPPGLLEVAFVRSPHAHALIRSVDTSQAICAPGVAAVLAGSEARTMARPLRARYESPNFRETDYPILALDRVRFVGQPIAAVVAADRYVAEDATELVTVEYTPLPAVTSAEAALAPGAPVLHEEVGSNVLYRTEVRSGDVDAAFRSADVVLGEVFRHGRQTGVPLEGRGCVAEYEAATGMLTLWTSTQIPHVLRSALAAVLGLREHRLRVVAPDVGGGFGIKAQLFPEEVVVCLLARKLGRAIKWVEDRREHLLASIHAREQMHCVEIAARKDGTLLAVRDRMLSDAGAYSAVPFGAAQEAVGGARHMTGAYKLEAYACEALGVATNKCPLGPYRGVARPGTFFVIEAMMDRLARVLDRDPSELRRKNLVQPGAFPYTTCGGLVLDSGSYVESLEKALDMVDYSGWRQRQRELRAGGRYVGVGIACYMEASAWGSANINSRGVVGVAGYEQSIVAIDPSGHVSVRVGVCGHGQGHETTLAQLVADELGVSVQDVAVIRGDTALCPYGMGTLASRSAVTGGGATVLAARQVRARVLAIASHVLEAAAEDLILANGRVAVRGATTRDLTLRQVAELAYFWPTRLPPGLAPGLECIGSYDPPNATFSNGTHVAIVEVDIETGLVRLLRYVVAEDCGPMINPMIVDGQVHGGVAQGIGGALYEELAYDDAGQMLSASLLDYLLPTACEVPSIEVGHLETPSPFTPGGRKGMGEGGTLGAHAAIANAIADALAPLGVQVDELPLTPARLRRLVSAAGSTYCQTSGEG